MLEKKEHQYEKAVLVGLITKDQDEDKLKEYMDELEFLAYTAGATVEKKIYSENVSAGLQNLCRKRKG